MKQHKVRVMNYQINQKQANSILSGEQTIDFRRFSPETFKCHPDLIYYDVIDSSHHYTGTSFIAEVNYSKYMYIEDAWDDYCDCMDISYPDFFSYFKDDSKCILYELNRIYTFKE